MASSNECQSPDRLSAVCLNEVKTIFETERDKLPITEKQREILDKMFKRHETRMDETDTKLDALTLAHTEFKAEIKADLRASRRFVTLIFIAAQAVTPILVFFMTKFFK